MTDGKLTSGELEVLNHLADAMRAFRALEVQHPADAEEMVTAIHGAQLLVTVRPTRRTNPELHLEGRS